MDEGLSFGAITLVGKAVKMLLSSAKVLSILTSLGFGCKQFAKRREIRSNNMEDLCFKKECHIYKQCKDSGKPNAQVSFSYKP